MEGFHDSIHASAEIRDSTREKAESSHPSIVLLDRIKSHSPQGNDSMAANKKESHAWHLEQNFSFLIWIWATL
jgi:hypothetical protein